MKFRRRFFKRAVITVLLSLFVAAAAQARQDQQRDKVRIEIRPEGSRPIPDVGKIPPPPTPIPGNQLQALAIKRVLPEYPLNMRLYKEAGVFIENIVIVNVTIHKPGNVSSAVALTGNSTLREAAVNAAKGWKWDPALVQDAPHGISGHIRFDFDDNATVSINTSSDPVVVDAKEVKRAAALKRLEANREKLREAPSPALYDRVAQDYIASGRDEEAVEIYKEATSRYPQDLNLYKDWLGIHLKNNENDEVVKVLERVAQIKLEPDTPPYTRDMFSAFLSFLGFIYLDREQYEEAKEVLERVLSDTPPSHYRAMAFVSLAQAYMMLGDERSAMNTCERLLKYGDKNAALNLLGDLYKKSMQRGDKKSAAAVTRLTNKVCQVKRPGPKPRAKKVRK